MYFERGPEPNNEFYIVKAFVKNTKPPEFRKIARINEYLPFLMKKYYSLRNFNFRFITITIKSQHN